MLKRQNIRYIQISFILFIVGMIAAVYTYQISNGASIHKIPRTDTIILQGAVTCTDCYRDIIHLHIKDTVNIKKLYSALLFLIILFPAIGIHYKKQSNILWNSLISLFLVFLLFQSLQFGWFGNCMDSCGFYTIFLAPPSITIVGITSVGILFFLNKRKS